MVGWSSSATKRHEAPGSLPAAKRGPSGYVRRAATRRWISALVPIFLIACDAGDTRQSKPPISDTPASEDASIVSLEPLATRFIIGLGARSELVAVGPFADQGGTGSTLPRFEGASALELAPRWLFVPSQLEFGELAAAGVSSRTDTSIVEFAPHDLEDLFELSRTIGREIVGRERSNAFEARISRPLSLVAAESDASNRPRVAAIVSADPLRIAGGHSFATDLLEIAGGSSVTHGGERTAVDVTATRLRALTPDVVVLMLPHAEDAALAEVRAHLPSEIPVVTFTEDIAGFWSEPDPARVAKALRRTLLSAWTASKPNRSGSR